MAETGLPADEGWPRYEPADAGVDPDALREAIASARVHETPPEAVAYDFSNVHPWQGEEDTPYGHASGPMPDRRGAAAGVVLRRGMPVAEWGDTTRVDHTFSAAKTALSVLAGIAWDRGLIDDVHDPVGDYVDDGGFDSPHNAEVAWHHLLQGTSEWEGIMFGRPDAVDRNRPVGQDEEELGERGDRDLREPGTYWEYNDVRVNRLSLSLLRVWAKPLPRVFAHEIMDPIGASRRWEWHGYHDADVTVEGTRMRSVSGGGHWGGGLWISARDLARFGHLLLRRGRWGGNRLLSASWVERMTRPCPIKSDYGYLVWLNNGGDQWPAAPVSSYAAIGFGLNVVWIDPEHDLVAVLRWLAPGEGSELVDGFLDRPLDAVG